MPRRPSPSAAHIPPRRGSLRRSHGILAVAAAVVLLAGCTAPAPGIDPGSEDAQGATETAAPLDFALAIHGGAGALPDDLSEERKQGYLDDLSKALQHGRDRLAEGAPSLDVVQEVVRILEDSPLFNAGKGAVFTHEGRNELDAAIMDGRDLNCGSVAGVTTIKNPVDLARAVMEESRHVFFTGAGAEQFAAEQGIETVEPEYFFVQSRYDSLQRALERESAAGAEDEKRGTVGAVALDRDGNLAAATSTGGLTNKRFGRVGDVPVIGAGTYANNATVAVSCTGIGEQFIRNNIAHDVSALVEYEGLSVEAAAQEAIGKLDPGDGGLIAVGRTGEIALVFNSASMLRGAADSNGRFEVAIWGSP
ncbi:MAG: isoaspartyl peptidase/L-asparaginase [Acidobacteriota bacterium]